MSLGIVLGFLTGMPSGPLLSADQNTPTPVDVGPYRILKFRAFEPPEQESPTTGMVAIPAGEFEMGDHFGEEPAAMPVHTVYVDAFHMDIYELTNQKYADALNWALSQGLIDVIDGDVHKAGDPTITYCQTRASTHWSRITWDGVAFGVEPDKESHPALKVSWYGAAAYSNWRSIHFDLTPSYDIDTWECDYEASGYRLASEAEWEKASRGGLHDPYRRYPWGDMFNGSVANYWGSGDPYETGIRPLTSPVGYFNGDQSPAGVDMANGYGLYDVGGNGWEWCNDWWEIGYYLISPYDNPTGPSSGLERALRGGSWARYAGFLQCSARDHHAPDYLGTSGAIRLVLDAD